MSSSLLCGDLLYKYTTHLSYNYSIDYFLTIPFLLAFALFLYITFFLLPKIFIQQLLKKTTFIAQFKQILTKKKLNILGLILFLNLVISVVTLLYIRMDITFTAIIITYLICFPYKFIFLHKIINLKNNILLKNIRYINLKARKFNKI